MARKRHSDEDVLKLLSEIEHRLGSGDDVASASWSVEDQRCDVLQLAEAAWRDGRAQMSKMKSLEKENAQLKKIVAELELNKHLLDESLKHLKPRA